MLRRKSWVDGLGVISLMLCCLAWANDDGAGAELAGKNGVVLVEAASDVGQQEDKERTLSGFVTAKPLPLRKARGLDLVPNPATARTYIVPPAPDAPHVSTGEAGNGMQFPVLIPTPRVVTPAPTSAGMPDQAEQTGKRRSKRAVGEGDMPYTMSRVDLQQGALSALSPYHQTGKLVIRSETDGFSCTASLIEPGVILTAAHCITDFGKPIPKLDYEFAPALYGDKLPFGLWKGKSVAVPASWIDGSAPGCENNEFSCGIDVAVMLLAPRDGVLPGTMVGWYAVGTDDWGFADQQAHVVQLGYPGTIDNGKQMQRVDSVAYLQDNSIVWGSGQGQGASGGPALVNFGIAAEGESEALGGRWSRRNVVVGVAEAGTEVGKQIFASRLNRANFGALLEQICAQAKDGQCR